jgi:hypothetical protein
MLCSENPMYSCERASIQKQDPFRRRPGKWTDRHALLFGRGACNRKEERVSRRRLHASVKCCVDERETEENFLFFHITAGMRSIMQSQKQKSKGLNR